MADTPIWISPPVPKGQTCCAIIELFASYHEIQELFLCTSCSTDPEAFPLSTGVYWPAGGGHPRGWWPYSAALMTSGEGVDGCSDWSFGEFGIGDRFGPDTAIFAWQGAELDPYGTPFGNIGLYGVNLTYSFELVNKCLVDKLVDCFLVARDTLLPFWGAACVLNNGVAGQLGVRKMKHGEPINAAGLDEGGPLHLPALTDIPLVEFVLLAVGGGSGTPVNFLAHQGSI